MCGDPLTIGLMALSGLGTYAQYKAIGQQADAQSAMYNAQAEQDRQNALIEQGKSKQIAAKYADEQEKLNAQRRLAVAHNIAEAGASNMVAGWGSEFDVRNAINTGYQNDALRLLTDQRYATTDSWIQQANYLNQANQYDAASKNVQSQAKAAQAATLIGGAASLLSIGSQWGTSGGSGMDWSSNKFTGIPTYKTPTGFSKTASLRLR